MAGGKGPYAFVTVGTTSFDALVDSVLTVPALEALKKRGIARVLVQIGRGREDTAKQAAGDKKLPLPVGYYRFKDSLADDMRGADLVICHAGAGTLLEALGAKKKVVVAINEDLMDNHQVELAKQLGDMHCLVYTTPKQILGVLEDTHNLDRIEELPPPNPEVFATFLNGLMGFR